MRSARSFAAIGERIGVSRHAARGIFIRAIRKLWRDDPQTLETLLIVALAKDETFRSKEVHRAA